MKGGTWGEEQKLKKLKEHFKVPNEARPEVIYDILRRNDVLEEDCFASCAEESDDEDATRTNGQREKECEAPCLAADNVNGEDNSMDIGGIIEDDEQFQCESLSTT